MTYQIEKKTPASNWYEIHHGLTADMVPDFLANVAKKYDANLVHNEVMQDLTVELNTSGCCGIGVYPDGDIGNDFIQYRAVKS